MTYQSETVRADRVEASRRSSLENCEAIIDAGIETFMEVGSALMSIKAGRLYKVAGYRSFESYCSERWQMSRAHAYRLVAAAEATGEIEQAMGELSPQGDIPLPVNERQVRLLRRLQPGQRTDAWVAAVDAADGAQPTVAQVRDATNAVIYGGHVGDRIEPVDGPRPTPPAPPMPPDLGAGEWLSCFIQLMQWRPVDGEPETTYGRAVLDVWEQVVELGTALLPAIDVDDPTDTATVLAWLSEEPK